MSKARPCGCSPVHMDVERRFLLFYGVCRACGASWPLSVDPLLSVVKGKGVQHGLYGKANPGRAGKVVGG